MDERTCRSCGTPLSPGATWCSACYKRSFHDKSRELAQELIRSFENRKTYHHEPPRELAAPAPPKRYSRWEGGPTTFGPAVKITLTTLVSLIAVPASIVLVKVVTRGLSAPEAAYPFFFVMSLIAVIVGGAVLRSIWRRARVR